MISEFDVPCARSSWLDSLDLNSNLLTSVPDVSLCARLEVADFSNNRITGAAPAPSAPVLLWLLGQNLFTGFDSRWSLQDFPKLGMTGKQSFL
jgi:hypothetical protein